MAGSIPSRQNGDECHAQAVTIQLNTLLTLTLSPSDGAREHIATLPRVHCLVSIQQADNWLAWRGPGGSGISNEPIAPLHWSTNQNVAWKLPLRRPRSSTDNLWKHRLLTKGHEGAGKTSSFGLYAKDTRSGFPR
jgi:hypothetical protein